MRLEHTVKIDDKEFVARELTVRQVETMLTGIDGTRPVSQAELLVDSVIPIEAVILSTGISAETMGDFAPSELQEIWGAVERVNGFLSRLLEKLLAAARAQPIPPNSAAPSVE